KCFGPIARKRSPGCPCRPLPGGFRTRSHISGGNLLRSTYGHKTITSLFRLYPALVAPTNEKPPFVTRGPLAFDQTRPMRRNNALRSGSLARDDFSRLIVDRLAKRVGMKCSYP